MILTVTAICLGVSPLPGKDPVVRAAIGEHGLEGDRHATQTVRVRAGRRRGEVIFNERQWSAVGEEELVDLGRATGVLLPVGSLGENFRFSGLPDLSRLPFGTRLRFPSGAVLLVSGQNFPCQKQADYLADLLGAPALRRGFIPAARERRGLVGWVEQTGTAAPGDVVAVEPPSA